MSENKKSNKFLDSLMKIPFFKKLKNIKHIEIIIVIIFVSLLLFIYFYGFKTNESSFGKTTSNQIQTTETSGDYAKELEEKILRVVTSLKGVKNATVVVSLKNEELVAVETTKEQNSLVTNDATTTQTSNIQGIVVVANGAEDINVRLNIYKIIETILTIPCDRIQVFAGK